jgi:phage gpG-like protein
MTKETEFIITPSLREVRKYLLDVEKRVKTLRVPLKKTSIFLDRWVQWNFRDQGQKLGSDKWPPFKGGGRKKKGRKFEPFTFRRNDRGARLLQDTGRLRNSFEPFYNARNAGVGSDLHYAKYHEYGVSKRNLPARRMLPKRKEIIKDVREIFRDHVVDSISKGRYPFKKGKL